MNKDLGKIDSLGIKITKSGKSYYGSFMRINPQTDYPIEFKFPRIISDQDIANYCNNLPASKSIKLVKTCKNSLILSVTEDPHQPFPLASSSPISSFINLNSGLQRKTQLNVNDSCPKGNISIAPSFTAFDVEKVRASSQPAPTNSSSSNTAAFESNQSSSIEGLILESDHDLQMKNILLSYNLEYQKIAADKEINDLYLKLTKKQGLLSTEFELYQAKHRHEETMHKLKSDRNLKILKYGITETDNIFDWDDCGKFRISNMRRF